MRKENRSAPRKASRRRVGNKQAPPSFDARFGNSSWETLVKDQCSHHFEIKPTTLRSILMFYWLSYISRQWSHNHLSKNIIVLFLKVTLCTRALCIHSQIIKFKVSMMGVSKIDPQLVPSTCELLCSEVMYGWCSGAECLAVSTAPSVWPRWAAPLAIQPLAARQGRFSKPDICQKWLFIEVQFISARIQP